MRGGVSHMIIRFRFHAGRNLFIWPLLCVLVVVGIVIIRHQPQTAVVHPSVTGAKLAFAWPEYPYSEAITDPALLELIDQTLFADQAGAEAKVASQTNADPRHVYWQLEIETESAGDDTGYQNLLLAVTPDSILWEPLAPYGERLAAQSFGELLAWPEANALFPIGSEAAVRDVETRLAFRVYRHRGSAHFDVEPVTAQDTEILRQIYGGDWSWKRRAVVLTVGGRQIAASMNGMPHGWGDIFNNNFRGHFCIHVDQSRVHTTWRPDEGHQLMVRKAAGTLWETLHTDDPALLADLVLAAVNHYESATLRQALEPQPDAAFQTELAGRLRHLTVLNVETAAVGKHEATVVAHVMAYYFEPDPDAGHSLKLELKLVRPLASGPWRVLSDTLRPLLDPP